MEEWDRLYKEGKLNAEIRKLCNNPKLKPFQPLSEKYTKDLVDFLKYYSNDSGAIPA